MINIHVVRAVTKALIESNPSMSQHATFDMPRSWVQSNYRRIGYTRRMGTTHVLRYHRVYTVNAIGSVYVMYMTK